MELFYAEGGSVVLSKGGLESSSRALYWGVVTTFEQRFTKVAVWADSGDAFGLDNITVSPLPEPATLSLLVLGGLLVTRRRR